MQEAAKHGDRLIVRGCSLGKGLFAGRDIALGEVILTLTGPRMTLPEVRRLGPQAANALQLGINDYIYLDEPARYVNHSCVPNAAIVNDSRLIATSRIAAGDQVFFDYSTTVSDGWTMPCRCGTPACRQLVVAFQLLPEKLRLSYAIRRHVIGFILDQVGA